MGPIFNQKSPMNPTNPSPQGHTPQLTPDQKAAGEWTSKNWTDGYKIAGADSGYVAFWAFVAGWQSAQEEIKGLREALEKACAVWNRAGFKPDADSHSGHERAYAIARAALHPNPRTP
jgi:hypothetical protein